MKHPRTTSSCWVAWGMSALYVLFMVGMVIILSGKVQHIAYTFSSAR